MISGDLSGRGESSPRSPGAPAGGRAASSWFHLLSSALVLETSIVFLNIYK